MHPDVRLALLAADAHGAGDLLDALELELELPGLLRVAHGVGDAPLVRGLGLQDLGLDDGGLAPEVALDRRRDLVLLDLHPSQRDAVRVVALEDSHREQMHNRTATKIQRLARGVFGRNAVREKFARVIRKRYDPKTQLFFYLNIVTKARMEDRPRLVPRLFPGSAF